MTLKWPQQWWSVQIPQRRQRPPKTPKDDTFYWKCDYVTCRKYTGVARNLGWRGPENRGGVGAVWRWRECGGGYPLPTWLRVWGASWAPPPPLSGSGTKPRPKTDLGALWAWKKTNLVTSGGFTDWGGGTCVYVHDLKRLSLFYFPVNPTSPLLPSFPLPSP